MLLRTLPVILGLLTVCLAAPLRAQSPTTKGQEFWLGFMENLTLAFNGPPEFALLISSSTGTRGTISLPGTGFSFDFVVPAGKAEEIRLPEATWNPFGSGVTDNKGIRITTDAPVSVAAVHYRSMFTESTIVLPLTELADEYVVLAARDVDGEDPSQMLIVATEDDTRISITPSSLTVDLRPANRPYTITLDKGQVYQLQARTDLTGTLVKAADAKKIALFAGARQADLFCYGDDSHIWDQNYPLSRWGKQYLVVPFAQQEGDVVKIIAAFDNTTVRFNCGGRTESTLRLKRGEYLEREISNTTLIESDNPISVAQFMKSNNCNPLAGPNMLVLAPFALQTKRATFQVLTGFAAMVYRNYINVVTKTDAVDRVKLDGRRLNATWKSLESNPLYSFTQYRISPGSHVLASDSSFYALSYGFDEYDAYTHSLGYETEEFLQPANIVALDLGKDTTLCPGQSLVLNATTPGALGYRWQDGSTGPVYTVTKPGEYKVDVSAGLCGGATGSIKVSYKENVTALNLGKDTTLCRGQSLVLDATTAGALGYRWQDGSTGPSYTVTKPGEYKVEVAVGPCRAASGSIRVGYKDLPPPQLGADTTLCPGQELLLSVAGPGVSYQWQDGSSKGSYLVSRPGKYTVTVSNGNCTASDEVMVDYEPALPGFPTEEKQYACGSDAITIDANLGLANVTYRWQDGTTGATFVARGPGTYRVEVASRCDKVSRTFKVESILPPNVFTPNGDGLNDCFEVPGIGGGEWTLSVYNRWGKPVYQQQGYDNAWCAEGAGDGVYYYQLTKAGGPPCPIKGWVQVLR
ncbi:MAG: gliding motility-associated C-terminal domain-containing protein [Cytophagales bacterium]|nr:gliding motility-associated C-terminal domain-containing protein [Cytophagales bacterium]